MKNQKFLQLFNGYSFDFLIILASWNMCFTTFKTLAISLISKLWIPIPCRNVEWNVFINRARQSYPVLSTADAAAAALALHNNNPNSTPIKGAWPYGNIKKILSKPQETHIYANYLRLTSPIILQRAASTRGRTDGGSCHLKKWNQIITSLLYDHRGDIVLPTSSQSASSQRCSPR